MTTPINKDLILNKRQAVADILIKARLQKGWSQTELGGKVGFAQNTIARIENCRFSPNADQLYALCEALEITISLNDIDI